MRTHDKNTCNLKQQDASLWNQFCLRRRNAKSPTNGYYSLSRCLSLCQYLCIRLSACPQTETPAANAMPIDYTGYRSSPDLPTLCRSNLFVAITGGKYGRYVSYVIRKRSVVWGQTFGI